MIHVRPTGYPALDALLARHREISVGGDLLQGDSQRLCFEQGAWQRELHVNDTSLEVRGLPELMDNNPMVCADQASIPGPAETMALIALGPLARAGLLVEAPVLLANFAMETDALEVFLRDLGWDEGFLVGSEGDVLDLPEVLSLTALCKVHTPEDLDDLDALYEEAYGRSFFVHEAEDGEWVPERVAGRPEALYRLAVVPDEVHCLLRVQVLAAKDGKAGAAQWVHALNIMSGLEESLPF